MKKNLLKSVLLALMVLVGGNAWAGDKTVVKYSFDDALNPSLTAGSRVSFDYDKTSVITSTKFLNAWNNTNGDPGATTVSLGNTDLSGETWTLSFEWAACGGCNSKADHTTLKAGDTNLFDLTGNSNWNTTVTITYAGSDGTKTLPVPGCDKGKRFTAGTGDQYNTETYWHHIVVTGSASGVKMTITNSSTGNAVVEDVLLSETNVNPTSLIIEPCCGGAIGIDELSLTYFVEGEVIQTPTANYTAVNGIERTITATCDTEGATLYYSTDSENWTEGASITVSASGNVYFKAVKGNSESDVLTFAAVAGEAITLNAPTIVRSDNTTVTISADQTDLLLSPTATITYEYGNEKDSFTGSKVLTVSADAIIAAYAEAIGYATSETAELAVALFPTYVNQIENTPAKTSGWSSNAFSEATKTASERTYAALLLDEAQWGTNIYLQTTGAWGLRASGNWYINSDTQESWILMPSMKKGDIIVVDATYPASNTVNATYSKYSYGTKHAYEVTEDGDVEIALKKINASEMDYLYGVYSYSPMSDEEVAAIKALQDAKDALQTAINEAKAIDTTDKEGVDALNSAIETAEAALTAENATVESLTAAKAALADAVKAFENANKPAVPEIVNANFEQCEAVAESIVTSGDAQGTDYEAAGWKLAGSGAWCNGAVFAYGAAAQLNGVNAPAAAPSECGEKALGVTVGWGAAVTYQSAEAITLPAGEYVLMAYAYNGNSAAQMASKLAFVPTTGDAFVSAVNSYPSEKWSVDYVTFTLAEATEGKFQVGGGAISGGSGANGKVFFDNLVLTDAAGLAAAQQRIQEYNQAVEDAKKAAEIAANTALVEGATIDNPVDAPFVVNPYFEENVNGWSRTGTYQNSARANNQQGDFTGYFWENWNGSAQVNKMYQVINNIPNGVYKLKIAAFVNNLQDPNESQYVFANADKTFLTTGAPTFYEVYTKVENNTLEIGLDQTEAIANWMGIDNITLLYFGAEGTVEDAKMAAPKNDWKIAKAEAEKALANEAYSNVTGEERTALEAEIRKDEPATAEAYVAATEALNAVTKAFVDAVASYDALADANALIVDLPYAKAEKKPEAKTATNAEAAATAAQEVLVGLRAYYESNALAEGVEGAENMTEKIANPAAEEAIGETWTTTLGEGSGGAIDIKSNEPWTDAAGNSTHKYFDGGNWGANAWDVTFSQNVTLAAGKYLLSAISRASAGVEQTLFAGEASTKTACIGSTGGLFNRGWNIHNVEFEVAEEGTVNIGVRGVTSNVHEWMSFADFRLVRIEKPAEPEFTPEYGTLWTDDDPVEKIGDEEPYTYSITKENKYFKGLVKEGDIIRVSISNVGYQPSGTRPLNITKGELNLLIDNAGGYADIQQGTSSYDFVLNADEIANIEAEKGANVVLTWKYMTVAKVELLEKAVEIDETLLEEAEGLASDASAVAVGKLLAAIEAYKKDGVKETLQAAMNQFKADNADQEADQTAKVATNGWKKFDGTAAGVCATQFAPAITTYDGRTANLAEVYENNGNRTGTIIYQDITGLTNGKYKVGFYGNAFSTSVRDGFECTMEDGATDVAYVFANEEKAYITARIATSTTENDFRQFDVEVTDGVIKLGMGKDTEKSTNWHTMQIYQLTWFTTAKELFAAAQVDLKATIEAAKALKNNYRTKGLDAFNEAIAEAEKGVDSNWYNNSEIQTLIDNLKNAMKEFRAANYFTVDDNYAAYIMDAENITEVIETENYKFMAAGHDYGTRGIVSAYGLDLTFEPAGNNMYYLNSQVSNGGNDHYLGSNLYMDAPASAWAFESVLGGFTITNGTQYISIDANDNLVLSDTPHTWAITAVSNMESLRKSALAEAKPEAPVDATFLLQNPNFNRNDQRVAAWVVSEDCTNKNLNGGNQVNNCAESFHSTFTISQTITDAPKGTYMMTAQGFYRQDTNDANEEITEDAPVFFAEAKAYTTSEVPVKTGEENSMSAASESFTAGLYTCEPVEIHVGDNGMLTVGVQGTASYQWVIFDNFRLTYYGITTTDAITEVNTKAENGVKTIYNLNGQKVEKAKKGLYIINGKKTVVK